MYQETGLFNVRDFITLTLWRTFNTLYEVYTKLYIYLRVSIVLELMRCSDEVYNQAQFD